jgi:hypothetical protein
LDVIESLLPRGGIDLHADWIKISKAGHKWLSVINGFTQDHLTLEADRGITSDDIVDALAELFAMRACRSASAGTAIRSSLPARFVPGSVASASRRSTSSPAAPELRRSLSRPLP